MIRKISACFAGGAAGAAVAAGILVALGRYGILDRIGVSLQPDQALACWMFRAAVEGGAWAILLLLPVWRGGTVSTGVLFGAIPAGYVLYFVLPRLGFGLYGIGCGALTPVLFIALGCAYGITATFWYRSAAK